VSVSERLSDQFIAAAAAQGMSMALEIQERRAADLTPADADALSFALGAVHFYAGSVGCSATSKEIKAARDLLEKLLHGRDP
jgi:hypothetical protein